MIKINDDQKRYEIEIIVGNILRIGVLLSAIVTFIGGILYISHFGNTHPHYKLFYGEPADLRNIMGIIQAAASFDVQGIIQLGLLLLIATPIVRVAFSVFAFAKERDYVYVLITLMVLIILLYTLVKS